MERLTPDIEAEVARRLVELENDALAIALYDLDGNGALDETERDLLRSVIRSELVRDWDGESEESVVLQDRYRLVRLVGSGAQGDMHLARDERENRFVAVKISSLANATDWKGVELFEREAQTLQNIEHPNIPAYYDYFTLEQDGCVRLVLVREYVHGLSVDELLKSRARLTEREILRVARDMLETFEYLHSLAPPVVHRDVKPSNIMRRTDGSHVLTDFGAVQLVLSDDVGGSTIAGTSGYMAPEQLMGRARPSSDLYALGATLLHLLTGRHPSELPVARLRFDWHDLANVDAQMAAFVDRLVEPAMEDRFQSASEALRHLPRQSTGPEALAERRGQLVAPAVVSHPSTAMVHGSAPVDSFIAITESEDAFEMRVPSRPGIGLLLLIVGLAIAGVSAAMVMAGIKFPAVMLVCGVGGGLYLAYLGLDTAYDATVLTIDRDGYVLLRQRLARKSQSDGAVALLQRAEVHRDGKGQVTDFKLNTKHDGAITVNGNCDEDEAEWCAGRINQFISRVQS